MAEKTVYDYCDELQLNLVAKRHSGCGKWDVRITHAWFNNPLLSASGMSFDDCLVDLNARCEKVFEAQRVGIQRKNRERENQNQKNNKRDAWVDRIFGETT